MSFKINYHNILQIIQTLKVILLRVKITSQVTRNEFFTLNIDSANI